MQTNLESLSRASLLGPRADRSASAPRRASGLTRTFCYAHAESRPLGHLVPRACWRTDDGLVFRNICPKRFGKSKNRSCLHKGKQLLFFSISLKPDSDTIAGHSTDCLVGDLRSYIIICCFLLPVWPSQQNFSSTGSSSTLPRHQQLLDNDNKSLGGKNEHECWVLVEAGGGLCCAVALVLGLLGLGWWLVGVTGEGGGRGGCRCFSRYISRYEARQPHTRNFQCYKGLLSLLCCQARSTEEEGQSL